MKKWLITLLTVCFFTTGAALAVTGGTDTSRVTIYNITENTMWVRVTDRSRTSVYVKNGSSVKEYYSSHSGRTAAEDIYAALRGTGSEIMTSNTVLVGYLKRCGANEIKRISTKGITVYVLQVY